MIFSNILFIRIGDIKPHAVIANPKIVSVHLHHILSYSG